MQLQKIDIDFDIHRAIETERRSFAEPPYIALRRMLGLPSTGEEKPAQMILGEGRPWREDGVEVPHGSEARMKYQRGQQVYEGHFIDGQLVVSGESFDTLSAAANALAVTRSGKKTQLNGWIYWEARFPGETEWRSLQQMREAARS